MKKQIPVIIALLLASLCPIEAQVMDEALFGLNISGGEFADVYPGVDGQHYGYPGYNDLKYAKDKGFPLIRLPFRWERIQPELGGKLNTAELAKIKVVLGIANTLGLKVVFDMHNFGRYCIKSNGQNNKDNVYAIIGSAECPTEKFCQAWQLLAEEVKGYGCIWGYDIMNEPYDMLPGAPWKDIAQSCVNAIREVDTETPIIISGDRFSSAYHWRQVSDNLKDIKDPSARLIYQAHIYFDHDTSGTYSYSYDQEGAYEDIGIDRLKPFVEWCKENGKTGYVGEYGIPDNDPRWLTVLDRALNYLYENKVSGTYWSAGPRWGNYPLSVQPTNNYTTDRPQMAVLVKYLRTTPTPVSSPQADRQQSSAARHHAAVSLSGIQYSQATGNGLWITNGTKTLVRTR